MLGVSALFYGLAMVNDLRLTHAVSEAVHLAEDDAAAMVATGDGSMTCYWSGTGPGGCFDDGLDSLDRVQVMGEGKTWSPPLLDPVTPRAQAVGVTPPP